MQVAWEITAEFIEITLTSRQMRLIVQENSALTTLPAISKGARLY